MKRKRKSRSANIFKIERLEDRKLLAADFGKVDVFLPLDFSPEIQQTDSLRGTDARNQTREDRNRPPTHQDKRSNHDQPLVIEAREIDGTGNNLQDPTRGSTDINLIRATTVEYADGISAPAGENRVSAREISNTVAAQTTSETNDRHLTDITWLWGQFIDHDIDLTEGTDPQESFDIEVPAGDPYFDPFGTGQETISLNRSIYDHESGTSAENPREQINEITAFLDGSVVYGSDEVRAAELRTFEGGLLKTSEGDLLPFNEAGLANAGGTSDSLFLAGDIRANENIALTAMHTLWVREHNNWANQIAAEAPSLSDEQIYQAAKAIVTAEIQAITFNEFLPALLGKDAIDYYNGYDPNVDPGINNVFSGAAYRFGHSMLSAELLRLNNDGSQAAEGNISLQNAFFSPDEISGNGIESLLLGASTQVANEIDNQVIDDIRNFLFGPPGAGGFDLASLNIQRGRDHGLADYNQVREDFGLKRVTDFDQITSDAELTQTLEDLYGTVDNIDVWVGGLAEDHVPGSSVGELFSTIIVDQFERIRDGDRLWYENVFAGRQLDAINRTSLADVIERNSEVTGLRDNIFFEGNNSEDKNQQHDHRDRIADNQRSADNQRRRTRSPIVRNVDVMEPDRRDNLRTRNVSTDVQPLNLVGNDQQEVSDQVDQNRERSGTQQRTRRTAALDNAFVNFDRFQF